MLLELISYKIFMLNVELNILDTVIHVIKNIMLKHIKYNIIYLLLLRNDNYNCDKQISIKIFY